MQENYVLTLILAVISSSWVGPTIRDFVNDRRKKKRPGERMILAIGRKQLLDDAKTYIKHGGIPEDDYEAFQEQYEAYIGMKGNSKVKKWCEEALKLPIIYED